MGGGAVRIVYLDELYFINLIINYLLLLATGILCNAAIKRRRLLVSAAAGALYAVLAYFPEVWILYTVLFKMVFTILLSFVAFGYHGWRVFLRRTLTFFLTSFAFAGAVFAFIYFLSPGGLSMQNGVIYINIPSAALIIVLLAVYLLLGLVFRQNPKITGDVSPRSRIVLQAFGRSAEFDAMVDMGNRLTDPMTGDRVIVLSLHAARGVLPERVYDILAQYGMDDAAQSLRLLAAVDAAEGFRLIPYRAVGTAHGLLLAFRPEKISIDGKPSGGYVAALSSDTLGGDENVDAIIGA